MVGVQGKFVGKIAPINGANARTMMNAMIQCGHCGCYHSGPCPRVKAIEYFQDGRIKRVEYNEWPMVTHSPVIPMTTITIKPPETT